MKTSSNTVLDRINPPCISYGSEYQDEYLLWLLFMGAIDEENIVG